MYAAIHNLETECFVGVLRLKPIEPGVGSHFDTALKASPFLGCGNEFRADFSAPVFGRDVPALDVTDGMRRIAAVGVRSETGLNESQERSG
jgi:hypothetical protein